MSNCPCNSGLAPEACCDPVIRGEVLPEAAEQLMRARYTAHTRADMDFVTRTHDPTTRDRIDLDATLAWARESEWLGLDVLSVVDGGPGDDVGTVEFVAHFREDGERKYHHEEAHFARDAENHWIYIDGDAPERQPVRRSGEKVGRNDPCPCGSGRKYKKCCAG